AVGPGLAPRGRRSLPSSAGAYGRTAPPGRPDPPSLALAQGASESGWGTSRFANEGNSLFGQWSWSGGIKPSEQRTAAHGDHRIAAFESTGMSVASYALNLNTHATYRDFRVKREEMR